MYYNFAAGSFLSKKLCSRLHSIEVDFYSKKGKVRFLGNPLGDIEVTYACTSSIARWKARVRLPIRHNSTFFATTLELYVGLELERRLTELLSYVVLCSIM